MFLQTPKILKFTVQIHANFVIYGKKYTVFEISGIPNKIFGIALKNS